MSLGFLGLMLIVANPSVKYLIAWKEVGTRPMQRTIAAESVRRWQISNFSKRDKGPILRLRLRCLDGGGPMNLTSEHIYAEKLRQLRQQLSETTDELQRKVILRQIEEIQEEIAENPTKT